MTKIELAQLIQDYFIALKYFYAKRTPQAATDLRNLENKLKAWSAQNRPWPDKMGDDQRTVIPPPEWDN